MNTYYGIRFLRPAQLFSLGLLSVPPHIVRHGRLTNSPASANVTLIVPRVADLATAFVDNQS